MTLLRSRDEQEWTMIEYFHGQKNVHMTILYRAGQISTLKVRTYFGHGEP